MKQIRDIRERLDEPEIGDGSFRERITPKLDFEATTLQKLIDWEDVLNEPVLTTDIPTSKLFGGLRILDISFLRHLLTK